MQVSCAGEFEIVNNEKWQNKGNNEQCFQISKLAPFIS